MVWSDDLENSKDVFCKQATPILKKLIGDFCFLPLEGTDEPVAKHMDKRCCIDYIIVKDGRSRGVASRLQHLPDYKSFTIRTSRDSGALTEFHKLNDAIKNKGLRPTYHVHGYVDDDGKIVSLAIMFTDELMDYLNESLKFGNPAIRYRHTHDDKDGQAGFYACFWDDIKRKGYRVKVYPEDMT